MKQKQWKETKFSPWRPTLNPSHPQCPQRQGEEKKTKRNRQEKEKSQIFPPSCKAITSPRKLPSTFWAMSAITSIERRQVSLIVVTLLFVLVVLLVPRKTEQNLHNLLKCFGCDDFFPLLPFAPYYVVCKKCFLFAEVRETRNSMQVNWMATRWWLRAQTYFTRLICFESFIREFIMDVQRKRGRLQVWGNREGFQGVEQQLPTTKCFVVTFIKSIPLTNAFPIIIRTLLIPLRSPCRHSLAVQREERSEGCGVDWEAKQGGWEVVRPLNNVSICQRQVSSSELSLEKVNCILMSEWRRFHVALIITC